jgi:hypothetical protein
MIVIDIRMPSSSLHRYAYTLIQGAAEALGRASAWARRREAGTSGSTPGLITISSPVGFSQTSSPRSVLPIFSQPHCEAFHTTPGKNAATEPFIASNS